MNRERLRTFYVCQECGAQAQKWEGRCPQCDQWNTLINSYTSVLSVHNPWLSTQAPQTQELTKVVTTEAARTSTGSDELNRVLGGGIVPGSLVLLSGDPGIGKSTMLLQICSYLATQGKRVLYISGEESPQQVKLRAERLSITGENLFLLAETNIDNILAQLEEIGPSFVVVDSIQTISSLNAESAPGTIVQVRECTRIFTQWAKARNTPIFLSGHVTKDGSIAGPRMLEHMVDVVLYIEGSTLNSHRILRAAKNRFGSTDEVGILTMDTQGIQDVQDPSRLFLSHDIKLSPGSVVVATQEGSRPLLAELQALTTRTVFAQPRRTTTGVDFQRLVLVAAVISKRLGIPLTSQDILINVAGGLHVSEPAADLGMAVAMLSSFYNSPCEPFSVIIGEIGLGGEVRPVPNLERRINEADRLGFKRAIIPATQGSIKYKRQLEIIPVNTIKEAVSKMLLEKQPYNVTGLSPKGTSEHDSFGES